MKKITITTDIRTYGVYFSWTDKSIFEEEFEASDLHDIISIPFGTGICDDCIVSDEAKELVTHALHKAGVAYDFIEYDNGNLYNAFEDNFYALVDHIDSIKCISIYVEEYENEVPMRFQFTLYEHDYSEIEDIMQFIKTVSKTDNCCAEAVIITEDEEVISLH